MAKLIITVDFSAPGQVVNGYASIDDAPYRKVNNVPIKVTSQLGRHQANFEVPVPDNFDHATCAVFTYCKCGHNNGLLRIDKRSINFAKNPPPAYGYYFQSVPEKKKVERVRKPDKNLINMRKSYHHIPRDIVDWGYEIVRANCEGDQFGWGNFRMARLWISSDRRRYNREKKDRTRPGIFDDLVIGPDGNKYLIGGNYGF